MRSTDFPFAVMPQRLQRGGPSIADRARSVAKGATFAFNDEIEASLRALAQLDPAAYQREVARIRAQQKAYEEGNPYESAGLEIGGALLPALLPGGQGPAAARMASLAAKAPRAARIAPVVGEAALYGVGAADSMADIPRSVLSEGAQALGMYGVGAAAAPRLKALGSKLAARLRPSKGTAPPAMAVKPQALPAPEAPLAVKPQGITAYHGSPHSFDRFDMSKIGTGEGAQAYGHGLYFAENEGVAKSYRDALSLDAGFSYKGKTGMTRDEVSKAIDADYGRKYLDNVVTPAGVADQFMDELIYGASTRPMKPERAALRDELSGLISKSDPGSMYQVRIDADPADFLDWDAPLSGQSQKVRAALDYDKVTQQAAQIDAEIAALRDAVRAQGRTPAEADKAAMSELMRKRSDVVGQGVQSLAPATPEQTQGLLDKGIVGVKYKDAGSRAAGDGSRNYVVFDDKLISILKKYGWVPGMAIPAAAMEEYEAEQELARGGFAVKKGR